MALFGGRALISGIGQSQIGRHLGRSGLSLTVESILRAIEDSGLTPDEIEGVASYPGAESADPGFSGSGSGDLIDVLGLKVNWYLGCLETPGQLGPVINACMAVSSGLARHVVCFRSVTESSAQRGQGRKAVVAGRPLAGSRQEWSRPYGARSPNTQALDAQRYMYEFGLTREQLGEVALNARRNAARNPNAILRAPMTMEDYLSARMITTPYCLFDCDIPCDGSTAVIISAAEEVPAGRPRLRVDSVGHAVHGAYTPIGTRPRQNSVYDSGANLWKHTNLTPRDVDVAELYDGFSIFTLIWLEALGFCEIGEGGKFIEGGYRIGINGELPVNTQGGQLSGGRLHGLGFLHEACVQLRGDGAQRQVPGSPRAAIAAAGGGSFSGCMLIVRDE